MTSQITLCDCGHPPTPTAGPGTGYGRTEDGKTSCYECCGKADRENMIKTGKTVLYLIPDTETKQSAWIAPKHRVTNWPGTLSFVVRYLKIGRHNIARKRYDIEFTGPDGFVWIGTQYGDNTQLCHCRRTKKRA